MLFVGKLDRKAVDDEADERLVWSRLQELEEFHQLLDVVIIICGGDHTRCPLSRSCAHSLTFINKY